MQGTGDGLGMLDDAGDVLPYICSVTYKLTDMRQVVAAVSGMRSIDLQSL